MTSYDVTADEQKLLDILTECEARVLAHQKKFLLALMDVKERTDFQTLKFEEASFKLAQAKLDLEAARDALVKVDDDAHPVILKIWTHERKLKREKLKHLLDFMLCDEPVESYFELCISRTPECDPEDPDAVRLAARIEVINDEARALGGEFGLASRRARLGMLYPEGTAPDWAREMH